MEAQLLSPVCIDEDQALDLLDGALTSIARAHLERHLDVCSACRKWLSDLARQSFEPAPR